MAEFLIELFSEEIPARFQKQAMDDLARLFADGLASYGLKSEDIKTFVTPRRLVLVAQDLPLNVPERSEEKKGPKVGAPDAAINGFLKSAGLSSLDQCQQIETPKGNFWVAITKTAAQKTVDILPFVVWDILQKFSWKKSQNWAQTSFKWVRPLRSIIALFDGQVLPYCIYLGNGKNTVPASLHRVEDIKQEELQTQSYIQFSNVTYGHRFMSKGDISVQNFEDYQKKLLAAHVIIDSVVRQNIILESSNRMLGIKGLKLKEDKNLLEEVAGLTEWPVPLLGTIEQDFMDIPPEVLVTTMRNNQKYFGVFDDKGQMQPYFVITANLKASDNGAAIITGNERVLRARFSDAKFFWEMDKQTTLESRLSQLKAITFHAKLGTVAQKVERMEYLAAKVLSVISDGKGQTYAYEEDVKMAARLSKADLVSGMVGEFPELQGIMGGYYAKHDGRNDNVASAIKEHYSPLGPSDDCPRSPVSVIVAMADKIDTLVGFFAIDEKPTGSKDPYALRRAALGVLRLIIENGLRFDIQSIFKHSYEAYIKSSKDYASKFTSDIKIMEELSEFFTDRLKAMLREKNFRHDIIDSVFGKNDVSDISVQIAKLEVLQKTLLTENGKVVLALYNRASNILKIEEEKDKKSYKDEKVKESLFAEQEEVNLFESLSGTIPKMKSALLDEDYDQVMSMLLSLRIPLSMFFNKVTVNDQNQQVRQNRLALISMLRDFILNLANFSLIQDV